MIEISCHFKQGCLCTNKTVQDNSVPKGEAFCPHFGELVKYCPYFEESAITVSSTTNESYVIS